MKHRITRHDFLSGTQVAIGASLLTPWTDVFGANATDFTLGSNYYSPAKTGLRGSSTLTWKTRVCGAAARVAVPAHPAPTAFVRPCTSLPALRIPWSSGQCAVI